MEPNKEKIPLEEVPVDRIRNYGIRYGILGTVSFIAIFFFMKWINLVHITELRSLNFVVLFFIVYYALRNYKQEVKNKMGYLTGLAVGILISMIAYVAFAAFMGFYLRYLDPEFMQYLKETVMFGRYMNPMSMAVVLIFEGGAGGAIITFSLMQLMKREPENGEEGGLERTLKGKETKEEEEVLQQ